MHTLNINLLIIDVWYKITYYEVSIDELKDVYIYIYIKDTLITTDLH